MPIAKTCPANRSSRLDAESTRVRVFTVATCDGVRPHAKEKFAHLLPMEGEGPPLLGSPLPFSHFCPDDHKNKKNNMTRS